MNVNVGKDKFIQEALLLQRDRAMLVNPCYVPRGMGVTKVSNRPVFSS